LDKPTRIADSSSTSIDHIITNKTNSKITPSIIDFQLTDHLPTFVNIAKVKKQLSNSIKFYRCIKQFEISSFCENLQKSLEAYLHNKLEPDLHNFNDSFQLFLDTLQTIINKHAPLK